MVFGNDLWSPINRGQNNKMRKSALIYDAACALHRSEQSSTHPECPERVTVTLQHLKNAGLLEKVALVDSAPLCSQARLSYAHDPEYVETTVEFLRSRQYIPLSDNNQECDADELLDMIENEDLSNKCCSNDVTDTRRFEATDRNETYATDCEEGMSSGTASETVFDQSSDLFYNQYSHDACLKAAGGAVEAALMVARGEVHNAFCLTRPPGHHADYKKASGFCFFNNVAVAAQTLLRETSHIRKILIFDWDVHHGDGTENIFYDDPQVLCFSMHQFAKGRPHILLANNKTILSNEKPLGDDVQAYHPDASTSHADDPNKEGGIIKRETQHKEVKEPPTTFEHGKPRSFADVEDEYRGDFNESVKRTRRSRNIDYVSLAKNLEDQGRLNDNFFYDELFYARNPG